MAETLATLNDKVDQLLRLLDDLPRRLLVRANQIVVLGGLSDISETLGIIKAGEFRAGNRSEPGRGFSGMRLAYPPLAYNNDTWNLVGVENDVLQVGIRAADGKLLAGGGSVVLDQNGVTASAGSIAGWQIQPTKLVSPGSPGIQIDSNGNIQTTDFTTDVKGWRIASDGTAEFQNAKVRGELQTTIFTKREVQVTGGTLGIFKSAGILLEDVTVTTGSFTIKIKDPQGSHEQLFSVNDVLRMKDATNDTWVKVTAVTDSTTHYTYTVQYQSGTSGVTYYAGQAVANYGSSSSRSGHIILTADDTNAPFIALRKHANSPWTSVTELLKIGNLNGSWGYTSEKFGVAIGEYASGKANITIDEDGAIRIRNYTNEVLRVDTSGIRVGEYASGKPNVFIDATTGALKLRNYLTDVIVLSGADAKISSVLKVTDVNSAIAIGNPPPVSASSGTGLWIDRTGLYGLLNNNLQVKIGSDGKLYAGGGNIVLDSGGLYIVNSGVTKVHIPSNTGEIGGEIRLSTSASIIFSRTIPTQTPEDVSSSISASQDVHANYLHISAIGNPSYQHAEINLSARDAKLNLTGDQAGYALMKFMEDSQYGAMAVINADTAIRDSLVIGSSTPASGGFGLYLRNGATIRESTAIACRRRRSSSYSIPHATWTVIPLDTTEFDTRPSDIPPQTEGGGIRIRISGAYIVGGSVAFYINSNGSRVAGIRLNGSQFIVAATHSPIGGLDAIINFSAVLYLNSGDFIELAAYQTSGSNLDVTYNPNHPHSPTLFIARIP